MMDERTTTLTLLKEFISQTEERIRNITGDLVFNETNVLQNCPFSHNHFIRKDKFAEHTEKCKINIQKSNADELPLPQSVEPGRAGSIFIDREIQFSILQNKNSAYNDIIMPKDIPQTWSYLQANFDTQEKLALYEYVIKNTDCIAEPEITIEYKDSETSSKIMTFAEVVSHQRKLSKSKTKYRTTKEPPLTQTDEIRRLIATQMTAYVDYIQRSCLDYIVSASKSASFKHKEPHKKKKRHRSRDEGDKHHRNRSKKKKRHLKKEQSRSTSRSRSKKTKHGK